MYHKFKKGKLEGNLYPRTDNEAPEGRGTALLILVNPGAR